MDAMNARGISRRSVLAGALGLALAGCDDDAPGLARAAETTPAPRLTRADAITPVTGWLEIAPWPYAPWLQALTAWTGSEALLFGGRSSIGGPMPSLPVGEAAGAYDARSNSWRPLTVAPFELYAAQLVLVGDKAYVLAFDHELMGGSVVGAHLWEYAVATDSWRELAAPPDPLVGSLGALGDSLVVWNAVPRLSQSPPIQLYDIASNSWRAGPANPWRRYRARSIVGLEDGRIALVEAPDIVTMRRMRDEGEVPRWRAALWSPGTDNWQALPPSGIPVDTTGFDGWAAFENRIVHADPRTRVYSALGDTPVPLGGYFDLRTDRWKDLPSLPVKAHVHRGSDKGDPRPEIGWNTRDLIRATGAGYALSYGWAYYDRAKGWCEMPSIPGDQHGLDTFAAVWAEDRLLFWSNAEVDPTADSLGYRIKAAPLGRAWGPECAFNPA